MKKHAILLVDDHPVMRYGLAHLISCEDDLEVSGEAGSASEALAFLERSRPRLVVVDISLPDRNGLELIRDIVTLYPGLPVLVVSMHDESLYGERALRAGARGYIMKEEAGEKLIAAARWVLEGRVFVSPDLSARILESVTGQRPQNSKSPLERLTDRELEVFQLIGEGRASRDIAAQLRISVRTVDAHRAHIKEKLALKDGGELVRHAVRWVETQNLG